MFKEKFFNPPLHEAEAETKIEIETEVVKKIEEMEKQTEEEIEKQPENKKEIIKKLLKNKKFQVTVIATAVAGTSIALGLIDVEKIVSGGIAVLGGLKNLIKGQEKKEKPPLNL